VVTVTDGRVTDLQPRSLEAVRWLVTAVDVAGAADVEDVVERVREALHDAAETARDGTVAIRIRLTGETPLHRELLARHTRLVEDIETVAAADVPDVWIERVDLATVPPSSSDTPDPSIAGQLREQIQALANDRFLAEHLEAHLATLRAKIPAAARPDELLERVRREVPGRAVERALSLVEGRRA